MAEDNSGTVGQLQIADGVQAEVKITIDSGKMEQSQVEYHRGDGTDVKTAKDTSDSTVPLRAEDGKETVVKLAVDTSVPAKQEDNGKATEAKLPMDNSASTERLQKGTKVKIAEDSSGAIGKMQIERGEETIKDNSGTIDQMGINDGDERTEGFAASILSRFRSIPRPKIRCCTLEEFKKWMKDPNNILFVLTIASVILGVFFGCAMREANLGNDAIELIRFPGDLLMSMLKMLMIPLIVSSLISGMSQLDAKSSGKMGTYTLIFYISTTVLAAILGVILIVSVHPGNPDNRSNTPTSSFNAAAKKVDSVDAFLNLFKNIFPDNLIKACTATKRTKYTTEEFDVCVNATDSTSPPVLNTGSNAGLFRRSITATTTINGTTTEIGISDDSHTSHGELSTTKTTDNSNGDDSSTTLGESTSTTMAATKTTTYFTSTTTTGNSIGDDSSTSGEEPTPTTMAATKTTTEKSNDNQTNCTKKTETKKRTEDSDGTNVLGLVCFSIAFGIVLGQLGPAGKPMVDFFIVLNEVTMRLVRIIIWYSPFGIMCLISGKILAIDDMEQTARQLGGFIIAVSVGLIIHGAGTLPLIFFVITRKNPLTFFKGVKQAWVTALGTASSSATLPVTFRCLEENLGVDKRVTHFVLPVGAIINMDGTALYEAMAAIFIAQMYDMPLGFVQVVKVSVIATLTSIGAASIPSAGLVSVIMVLTALGIPEEEVTMIAAVDWLLDRIRTSVNVLGDSYGAGIVAHLSRDELATQEILREEEETKEIEEGGNRRKSRLSIIRRKVKPVLVDDNAEM